jgi:hypothetical protein
MSITTPLPTDSGGRKFAGPNGKLPAGTTVGATDYAIAHVLLVDLAGTAMVGPRGVFVQGGITHDAPVSTDAPLQMGGVASAAAPPNVSTDGDAVRAWLLRNGAQAMALTAAGALIGGDATNGLDVDVTRLPALVAGTAIVGKVGIDQTTPGTTNAVQVTQASLTMTHSNFTVNTTSATILVLNANRKYARLQNDGATTIYLNFGATAVAGQGIRLEANGGVYELSAAHGNLTTGGIRAIVASGTSSILVTEGV